MELKCEQNAMNNCVYLLGDGTDSQYEGGLWLQD